MFEDHGKIRVMPEIRAKSSTTKTDHVQVQEIKRGSRAKSHWTVKVDKKTASFTSKRKAEEAAAALREDLSVRQPETASAEDRAVAPAPEVQGASAPDTKTGEPEAQAAAPDTSAVAPAAVTRDDGDEILQVGGGAGVQGVEGVESAEGVAGPHNVVVKREPEDNFGDIKMTWCQRTTLWQRTVRRHRAVRCRRTVRRRRTCRCCGRVWRTRIRLRSADDSQEQKVCPFCESCRLRPVGDLR